MKRRFFDTIDNDILAITTTYRCNEWLGEDDKLLFEKMKVNNPRRFAIEGDGNWGVSEGLVYENWVIQDFDINNFKGNRYNYCFAIDFGYTNDPTALICLFVDTKEDKIYIFDEHYQKGMSNKAIADMIKYKGYEKEVIIADSSEPKSIDELRSLGIRRIKGALKGKDSILSGIQFIQNFKIIVHPKCENTIVELSNYIWDTKEGRIINKPVDDYNHLMDAFRYATERLKKATGVNVLK